MTLRRLLLMAIIACPSPLHASASIDFADISSLPRAGVLVVPTGESRPLPKRLDTAARTALEAAIATAGFKAREGKTLVLYNVAGYDRVVLAGTGEQTLTPTQLQDLGGSIAGAVRLPGTSPVAVLLEDAGTAAEFPAAQLALGLSLGSYAFDRYKSVEDDEDEPSTEKHFVIYTEDAASNKADWNRHWAPVAAGVFFARDLISEPANVIFPASFVERTRTAFQGLDNVRITVLDEGDMGDLGMGALLGVGMGSERPPRLLVVEYEGSQPGKPPLIFVGKGVTFDSGGISLKSGSGMWKMKYDMSGAAAATGSVLALAGRQARVNAVAIAALVENMPSQRAQRPGDVRKTMSGKTIEVLNTDAEGRLILADAVWYAQQEYSPALLIDVATLTGSVRTALGEVYAGLFTRQDELADAVTAAGKASGEEVWRLPLHETFRKAIKSDIADIKNVTEGGGGASIGAEVIGSFVAPTLPWAHLDIAGKAWVNTAQPTVPKGAAGWGVRLLNQLVLDHYE